MTATSGALHGRVAIVTGAARGLGRAVAERYADEGAHVVIADTLIDEALDTADDINRGGGSCLAIETDVSSSSSVAAMTTAVRDTFGPISILVNNAGLVADLPRQPFDEIAEDDWDRVMAVNVKGMWQTAKAVVGDMRSAGYGKIINVSSDTVLSGVPGLLHYVSSKGAVWSFTRALAHELGAEGIRVNAVAPGFTETAAALTHGGDASRRSIARRALPRAQTADDLTGTMVYLASSDSDFVTGQLIAVNGGYVLH
jgi:3-oxoacyl-[acyl-carrier protein] reductase